MDQINHSSIRFYYNAEADLIEINAGSGWGSRLESSVYLLIRAFNKVRDLIHNDFVMNIALTDKIEDLPNDVKYYGFSTSRKDLIPRLIPAPFFDNWLGCKIKDYEETCYEIFREGQSEPIYDKCFWAGNINTCKSRVIFYNKFKDNKNFDILEMSWDNSGLGKDAIPSFMIPMKEQTKYKYLIDISGCGWSGRLPYLMFSNRPIFYVKRESVAYYENDLKPFVHYIPVNEDLSDLEDRYLWAEENYNEAKQIAKNALDYAFLNLKRDTVINYYASKIMEEAAQYN